MLRNRFSSILFILTATISLGGWGLFVTVQRASAEALVPLGVQLEKVVANNFTDCASGGGVSETTVPANTEVILCWRMNNTGPSVLTNLSLEDDRFGVVLSRPLYQWQPGQTLVITRSAVITQTATEPATLSVTDTSSGDNSNAKDSVTLTVLPPAMQMEKAIVTDFNECASGGGVSETTVPANSTVMFCWRMDNVGLSVLSNLSLSDSRFGVLLSQPLYQWHPEQGLAITRTATITQTTTDPATLSATENGSGVNIESKDSVTVNVSLPSLQLEKVIAADFTDCASGGGVNKATVPANSTVIFCWRMNNTGSSVLSNFTLSDVRYGELISQPLYQWSPGQTLVITRSAVITQSVTEAGTLSVTENGSGVNIDTTDSAIVTVLPPDLQLEKYIVTNFTECATGSGATETTVPVNTTVMLCWRFSNTGSSVLTNLLLVDDRYGKLVDDPLYQWPAGQTIAITRTAVVTQTVTEMATLSVTEAGSGVDADATDSVLLKALLNPSLCDIGTYHFNSADNITDITFENAVESTVVWDRTPTCGEENYTGGSGSAACVSSRKTGDGLYDTSLRLPALQVPADVSSITLKYLANYQDYDNDDRLDLDISLNNGTTWTTLTTWKEDHGQLNGNGEQINLDMSAYIGQPSVTLRWRYVDDQGPINSPDLYAQIDDISFVCTDPVTTAVQGMTQQVEQPQAAVSLPLLAALTLLLTTLTAIYHTR